MHSVTDSYSRSLVEEAFRPLTLIELLSWRALNQPHQKAYTFLKDGDTEEVCLTYEELHRKARAIASMLQELGPKGARALLLYPPGLEYVAAFFGCLYAEMVAVPAYPPDRSKFSRSLPRLHSIVSDAQATVALTTAPILSRAHAMFDESPLLKSLSWASGDNPDAAAKEEQEPNVSPDALAFLQYTSGSTGTPKGVMLSHANLLHNAGLVYQGVEHTATDSYVSWLPTFHDMGFMAGILQPLFAGIPVVSMSPVAFLQRPLLWLEAISRYHATTSGGPNFAYDLCVRKTLPEQRAELDLSSWTVAFNGAEPVRPETLDRFVAAFGPCGFRREAFYPCYGLAEATLIVSGGKKASDPVVKKFLSSALENNFGLEADAQDEDGKLLVGCGKALLEQEIVIVHPESLTECLPGEVGEVLVSGGSVAQGYWNLPEETEKIFHAHLAETGDGPFLRTGDLGFLSAGELYVTGRLKDLIIIRGLNHYPQDIELSVERSHPALRPGCGAAFSVDVEGEERLVVVQEVEYRHRPDVSAVIANMREAIAQEHEIQTYAIVLIKPGRIPKTTSGKTQRRACRAAFLSGSFEVVGEWHGAVNNETLETTMEETPSSLSTAESIAVWLASEIAARMAINPVNIDVTQAIGRCGLDSLAAIELTHRIEIRLGVVLPITSFFQSSSIAELAQEIDQRRIRIGSLPNLMPTPSLEPMTAQLLSHGQQALWFLHQLAPESPVYNIAVAVRVQTAIDVPALRRAFLDIVGRHPSLRTTFTSLERGPVQNVHPEFVPSFQEIDASHWDDESLNERLAEEANRPFDLEGGPLLRVSLYARAAEEYVLMLAVHHIVADFWSLAIMMNELGVFYASERVGATAALATQKLQYTDYVRWQTEMLAGPEGERLWQYWQEHLSGELPVLQLPTDRPRPQIQTYGGASFSFKLDADVRDKLKGLGQSRDATLYMSLLAAFQVLLHRYARQDLFLVGSPMAGRSRAELAGIVGYFVNPLVLRADLSGNPTFAEYLDHVRRVVLDAFDHQDYPFPLLVERLQPERDASRSPLVQVMFALQKAHLAPEQGFASFSLGESGARMLLGGLPLESLALSTRVAQFDLTLMMSEDEGGLNGSLQYNKDLFDKGTIERMAGHFQTLIEAIINNPQQRLSDLPLLSSPELQQVLVEWNKTQWEQSSEALVHRLFEAQAAQTPDALAVASADEQLTYQELNARANQVARYLRRLGVEAEVVTAICMERSVEMIVGQLGILKAGGAYLPLDPASPPDRLNFMLRDSGARVLLTQQRLAQHFSPYNGPVLCLDSELILIAPENEANLDVEDASTDNLAYIIYTSGSTGLPKGVEIQHNSLLNLVKWHQRAYGITSGDRATQLAGPAFDASIWELWPYLTAGASIHIPDDETRVSARTLLLWLANEGITICFLPTPLAERLIDESLPADLVLRAILTGGDVLHKGPSQALPFVLVNHYGPTESTVVTTRAAVAQATEEDGPPPIGHPIDNTQTYLLDENLRPVPIGVPGELYIGGVGLARGYVRHPDMTAAKFIPNPFSSEPGARLYRTGDLARCLSDGQINFIGRIDNQVKIRGSRIELGEIEAVLRLHVQVREAIVSAREDVPGNYRLVAYVVPATGQAPTPLELQSFLKGKLPEYMIPTATVMLDEIPLTPNGKFDRLALPAPQDNGTELESIDQHPRTHVEELLAGIYAQVLGLKRVGIHDNFFALGGHSLMATQVISRIRQAFQVEIPLHSLFSSPSIASLAGHIETAMSDGPQENVPPLVPALRDNPLPVSFAQQRLWFLDQLEPGNALYNVPVAVNLRGCLDESALERSFSEIVRRHESLRTSFRSSDGQPVQIISAPQPFILQLHDLRLLAEDQRRSQSSSLIAQEARRPFDLSAGSLIRAGLLRLADEEYVLMLTLHHIISDGWSMGVFVQELSALYEAFSQGKSSSLSELPIQFADYAAWQRQWLQDEVLDAQVEYWQHQLATPAVILELPTDRPRPRVRSFQGASETLVISNMLSEKLKALSQREGVTLFMTLLAIFQILLARYSGRNDIVVGTPVAGRHRLEIEGLVGLFVNTLVLRSEVAVDATFSELVSQVREVVLAAHAHQDVPFEKLVEALQPERDLSRSPLFQVMFAFQNITQYPRKLADIEMRVLETDTSTAKFDITLHVEESQQELIARLEYSTDLFDGVRMRRLLGHFEELLKGVVGAPGAGVMELPMLRAEEEREMAEWNETGRGYEAGGCVHEMFERQVERSGGATGLISGGERVSYEELNRRANQVAHQLKELGVRAESRVGIMMERSVEMVVSMVGVLKAGGAYVPLDPGYPQERLSFMIGDAGVEVLLTQAELRERAVGWAEVRVVCVEPGGPEQYPESNPGCVVGAENLAYVIYTSGSTGVPKGVGIRHGSAVTLLQWAQEEYRAEQLQTVLASTSINFDLSVFELFAPLSCGGTVLLVENALALATVAEREQVTLINTVPSAMAELVRLGAVPQSVQVINLAGEALTRSLVEEVYEQRPQVEVVNLYGPTEDTTYSTWARVSREPGAAVTIGRPLAETQVYLVAEPWQRAPVGVWGEVYLGGAGLARGYLGRAGLTAEKFLPDPFSGVAGARLYRTGDVARYRADGELEYLGRVDQQVKLRGYRIELGEVESHLRRQPGVQAAVVVVSEPESGERQLVAYVVGEGGAELSSSGLRAALRRSLPEYMVPQAFVALAELPLTANGKLDRSRLPAVGTTVERERAYEEPGNEIEAAVAGIWGQVLGRERVSRHDNFFALGGHSLLATRVMSRVREAFKVEVPLRSLFESPSVAGLSGRIQQAIGAGLGLQFPPLRKIAREGELPLSYAQQRLWFLDQLEPGSAFYNIPAAVRLTGTLSSAALAESFNEVVRRHEALRTRFTSVAGQAAQVIEESLQLEMEVIDLSHLPERERNAAMTRLAKEKAQHPFELERGPLMRLSLLKLADQEHVLLVTMHHIISDGWSINILMREVADLYQTYLGGESSALSELAIQYADYAAWQREWLTAEVLAEQLGYWRGQLAGAPALLELPADRPRPAVQSFQGATESIVLGAALSDALKALSQREGVTLFTTLLAVFQILLARYSGQKEIVVGSPIANRRHVETEELIGCFVNTLVLRSNLADNPSFRELLKRTWEVVIGAHAHQDVPFEKLVEALQPERDLSRAPLFQVMFVLQNATAGSINLPGLGISLLESDSGTARFDLTLSLAETTNGLAGTLEYSTDLFDGVRMRRLLGHFEELLKGVVGAPGAGVMELPMLRAEEEREMAEWNETGRGYEAGGCVHEMFERQVERSGGATGLISGGERVSYEELNRRANQVAHQLKELGVRAESRVGIMMERSVEMVVSMVGVLKAGGAYVPLDPGYPQERLSFMIGDAGVEVLLTQAELRERAVGWAEVRVVCVEPGGPEQYPESNPGCVVGAENLAYVIYTSGSTGVPKGVGIRHGSAVTLLQWAQEEYRAEQLQTVLASTSINFDLSVFELFAPLSCGGTVLLVENALALATVAEREQVTLINTVPSAMAELVRLGAVPQSVQVINLAGEALTRSLVEEVYEQRPQVEVVNLYGPTEDTTYSTWARVSREPGAAVTIGRPLAETQVYLVAEPWQRAPVGVWGEVYLGGAGLARGYLGRAGLTAEKFLPDPFSGVAGARLYRTGDVARYRADGELEYLGRVDQQVKLRGYRIELGEVESHLRRQPGVQAAVVVVSEPESGERQLVAYVVGEGGAELSSSGLRAALRRSLPEYMVPQAFVALAELPLTANGKLDRSRLPAVGTTVERERAYEEPGNEIEAAVAGIWGQVLGRERVSRHDNFFALGGHSLLATRVMSRVREAFKVEVPLRSLFESPSVAGLSGRIQQAIGAGLGLQFPPLRKIAREGELPLSYAQQRLWFLDQLEPGSAFYNIPAAVRLTGTLSSAALAESFNEVVRRHEALRTRFTSVAGQAAQVIEESLQLEMEVIDLSHLPERERNAAMTRLAKEKAQHPFELERGPLMRLSLLKLADQEHVLLVTMHHIISDGWSINILMREVADLYQTYLGGESSALSELAIQYADYAAWQREWLTAEVLAEQLGYWRGQLAGAPALLELPADRPRPAVQSFQGATESIVLGAALSDALKALSQREGVTLFTTLLAVFQILLARYSGQKEIVVGSPIANRRHVETEELIGCFVNTLVLRSNLADNPSFRELLKRTWEVVIGAHAHQDVPFEKLVEALQPERDLSRAPLFQVMFVLQNATAGSINLPGLGISLLESDSGTARFDLTLSLAETTNGLAGTLEYSTDLFDGVRMRRLLGHFEELLKGVVGAPGAGVMELPMLRAEEEREMAEWNETGRGYEAGGCVHEMFERQVERSGGATGLISGGERVSYEELNRRANQVAHQLKELGVRAESRVGIMMERSVEMVVSMVGVLKAGGAYVPLDPGYPQERLSFMIGDAGVEVLLTQAELRERAVGWAEVRVVCVEPGGPEQYPESNPGCVVGAENLAYVIYTSGSTGVPKGVGIRHGSAVTLLQWAQEEYRAEQLQTVLASTSINFDLSVFELFAPLSCGGTVLLVENALALATVAEREQVTLINTVPSAMAELVRLGAVPQSVQVINLAGEALTRSLVEEVYEQRPQVEVVNLYGPTEDTTYSTWARVSREPGAAVTIGRPLAETQVYLVAEPWQRAPVGVWGEVYLGGAGLARGYLGRAGLTAEKFLPDPFSGVAGARLYRTGDVARYRADGELEYLGRVDQQVKLRGYRIELGEVESHLRRQPGVQAAVVVVSEPESGERQLVAYVVGEGGAELSSSGLRAALRRSLPEYMVPQAFVALAELPLTANGKLDRSRLPAVGTTVERERAYEEPGNEIEAAVAGIWGQVLGRERVSRHDNFFALGGHSLLATRVMYSLRERFNVELSLRVLFESPTVAELAEVIEKAKNKAAAIAPLVRERYRVKASVLPAVSLPAAFEGGHDA